jgi:hypothetical protein
MEWPSRTSKTGYSPCCSSLMEQSIEELKSSWEKMRGLPEHTSNLLALGWRLPCFQSLDESCFMQYGDQFHPPYILHRHSMALSPQANCTDWTTATGRRILIPTFADRGVSRGQGGETPTAVILIFLDRSLYFLFHVAPHLSSRGWVDPVKDPPLFGTSCSVGNRIRYLWISRQELWPLDHGGGHRHITAFQRKSASRLAKTCLHFSG